MQAAEPTIPLRSLLNWPRVTGRGIVVALVSVGIATASFWWHHLNAVPPIETPAPPLPAVNGYDVLKQASAAVKDGDVITWANVKGDWLPASRKGQAISLREKAAALEDNRETLALIRRSLTLPYQNPPLVRSFDKPDTEPLEERRLARLLDLEGEQREAQGDHYGAVQSRLDAMALGADQVPRGRGLAGYVTGDACELIGRRPLWARVNTLNADQARTAAQRLQEIEAHRVSLADSLTEEKGIMQASLHEVFRQRNVFQIADDFAAREERFSFVGWASTPSDRVKPRSSRWPLYEKALRRSKTDIQRDYSTIMDARIAWARKPYSANDSCPSVHADPIDTALFPDLDRIRFREAVMQTQDALLTAAFALRAYRAAHHDYPASLTALIADGDLAALPVDGFSPSGESVRYRRLSAEKYLLYSVGPNGRDEGGIPIRDDNDLRRRQQYLDKDSRAVAHGDYVVGVDLY